LEKVELATIIGTIQSMADYFPGLSSRWAENQEDERLLGVDLNNLMNVPTILDGPFLRELKELAVDTNRKWAKKLGIKAATGVTCVKPSGNTSVLLSTSPGIHALWSEYYIRRIQLHKDNPVLTVLREAGVPTEPSNHLDNTFVASFPEKAPTGAITNGTLSALEQLDVWKLVKTEWAEHSVSCTISYREWERDDIVKWLYENQEVIVGLSFLPKSDTIYEQSPYEKITKDRYEVLMREMPDEIDWSRLYELEENLGDVTNASQTAACDSDKCLISF
jgi:ribonucleoside-diphosphate reductase alpha chain